MVRLGKDRTWGDEEQCAFHDSSSERILPTRVFDFLFGQVFGIYHTMDQFTGRNSRKEFAKKAS